MKKIFWLTGLQCSGKTTIAWKLARYLQALVLDSDDVRRTIGNGDYTPEGKERFMRMLGGMAYIITRRTNVVVASVSHSRHVREEMKGKYPNFYEVYVKCDIEVCKARDVKGLYARASNGESGIYYAGIHFPYEEPLAPVVTVETDRDSVDECVSKILSVVE